MIPRSKGQKVDASLLAKGFLTLIPFLKEKHIFMTIKEARIKTKRSPEEVAKLLGFPLKTWLAWEEEEKKPPKYIEKLILERLQTM